MSTRLYRCASRTFGCDPKALRTPDFILIDDHGTYWIVQGKADSEMTSPIVTAKRDAARAWTHTVNASGSLHDQWAYLRASESVTANSTTWLVM